MTGTTSNRLFFCRGTPLCNWLEEDARWRVRYLIADEFLEMLQRHLLERLVERWSMLAGVIPHPLTPTDSDSDELILWRPRGELPPVHIDQMSVVLDDEIDEPSSSLESSDEELDELHRSDIRFPSSCEICAEYCDERILIFCFICERWVCPAHSFTSGSCCTECYDAHLAHLARMEALRQEIRERLNRARERSRTPSRNVGIQHGDRRLDFTKRFNP
jgi:hypothetical protein